MKPSPRHRIVPLTLSLAGLLLFGGCTTTTRLGDLLIPKHPDSDRSDGELVRLDIIDKPAAPESQSFSVSSLAVVAAGVAVDWTVEELKREAERYEAQFGSRIQLRTDELRDEKRLVLTRWIKGTLSPGVATKLETLAPGLKIPDGKDLAFIFVARLTPLATGDEKTPAIYALKPSHLWDRRSSAKVVDFHPGKLSSFWQWPGALIFKTDDQVSVKIETTLKALVRATDGSVKPVVLDPSFPIAVSQKANLSENDNAEEISGGEVRFGLPLIAKSRTSHASISGTLAPSGDSKTPASVSGRIDPTAIPTGDSIRKSAKTAVPAPEITNATVSGASLHDIQISDAVEGPAIGFLSIEFTVTETDASNARKIVEKGAASLEKRKDGIVGKVGGWFD